MWKSKLDERQKMDQFRAEHYAFWVMWTILAADLIWKAYLQGSLAAELKGETLAFMAGTLVCLALTLRRGLWDSRIRFSLGSCLGVSVIITAFFSALFALGKYRNYESCREDVTGMLLPMTAIFGGCIFILSFAVTYLTGKYAGKREKKIDEDLE